MPPVPADGVTDRPDTSEHKKAGEKGNAKGKLKNPEPSKTKGKDRPKGGPDARPEPRPDAPKSPRMTTPPTPAQKPAPERPAAGNHPKATHTSAKKENVRPVRPPRPNARKPPSQERARALAEHRKHDRRVDAQEAPKIEDKDDAQKLIHTILGGAAAGAVAAKIVTKERPGCSAAHAYRPPVEEVGSTQMDRDRNVGRIAQRFQGNAPAQMSPPGYAPAGVYRDERGDEIRQDQRIPEFYNGNRRVVRYATVNEIPPVIVASRRLNRVEVAPLARSPDAGAHQSSRDNRYYNEIPANTSGADAYAVSYEVDPNSAVSRDDILFRQGSSDFADAYSFDLVIDLAESMNTPSLINKTFVIEGDASSAGDYGRDLLLSQECAERIARDLVYYGVSPDRLMPVGYGETEAAHPADAPEEYRSLDRRIMAFRMR